MALVRNSAMHRDQAEIARSIDEWNRHMQIVEQQLLATGAYIAGEQFTLADIVIGLSMNRWLLTPMQRPALFAVHRYCEKLQQRPGFQLHGCNGIP